MIGPAAAWRLRRILDERLGPARGVARACTVRPAAGRRTRSCLGCWRSRPGNPRSGRACAAARLPGDVARGAASGAGARAGEWRSKTRPPPSRPQLRRRPEPTRSPRFVRRTPDGRGASSKARGRPPAAEDRARMLGALETGLGAARRTDSSNGAGVDKRAEVRARRPTCSPGCPSRRSAGSPRRRPGRCSRWPAGSARLSPSRFRLGFGARWPAHRQEATPGHRRARVVATPADRARGPGRWETWLATDPVRPDRSGPPRRRCSPGHRRMGRAAAGSATVAGPPASSGPTASSVARSAPGVDVFGLLVVLDRSEREATVDAAHERRGRRDGSQRLVGRVPAALVAGAGTGHAWPSSRGRSRKEYPPPALLRRPADRRAACPAGDGGRLRDGRVHRGASSTLRPHLATPSIPSAPASNLSRPSTRSPRSPDDRLAHPARRPARPRRAGQRRRARGARDRPTTGRARRAGGCRRGRS